MVAVMDATFFGRTIGYLVVRGPHRKENVYWVEIENETIYALETALCASKLEDELALSFYL